jgi:hypothetical protein
LHDKSRVDEPDERDEEADADGDRLLELERDRLHDFLPHPDEHEGGHERALQDDDAHRLRKTEALAGDERERHDCVQAEPGCDRVRPVRDEPHEDRHHSGNEARGGEDAVEGKPRTFQPLNAGEAEDRGVYEDDVGHDDEGRHARHRVPPERRPVFGEAEATIQSGGTKRPC